MNQLKRFPFHLQMLQTPTAIGKEETTCVISLFQCIQLIDNGIQIQKTNNEDNTIELGNLSFW